MIAEWPDPKITKYDVATNEWTVEYRGTEYRGMGRLPSFMPDLAFPASRDEEKLA